MEVSINGGSTPVIIHCGCPMAMEVQGSVGHFGMSVHHREHPEVTAFRACSKFEITHGRLNPPTMTVVVNIIGSGEVA